MDITYIRIDFQTSPFLCRDTARIVSKAINQDEYDGIGVILPQLSSAFFHRRIDDDTISLRHHLIPVAGVGRIGVG